MLRVYTYYIQMCVQPFTIFNIYGSRPPDKSRAAPSSFNSSSTSIHNTTIGRILFTSKPNLCLCGLRCSFECCYCCSSCVILSQQIASWQRKSQEKRETTTHSQVHQSMEGVTISFTPSAREIKFRFSSPIFHQILGVSKKRKISGSFL
jgi:hypothetical protein